MELKRVATDGDANEILDDMARHDNDDLNVDYQLTKIMTPLSGHRFQSEKAGVAPGSSTPQDTTNNSIRLKKKLNG
jgi:hypothetical protein